MDEQTLSFIHSPGSERSSDLCGLSPELPTPRDLWFHERKSFAAGHTLVAGIDEAGRGPLAGPVVAACALLPRHFDSVGIDDSKRLSEKQRKQAYERFTSEAITFAVGIAEPSEIDRINILQATHLAMGRAVAGLPFVPHVLLIDGRPVPNLAESLHIAIVGGDALSVSIAAASIIAKVTRDQMMCDYAGIYPEYGFDQHKGYGSKAHLCAIETHGPCPIHRLSFSPLSRVEGPVLL